MLDLPHPPAAADVAAARIRDDIVAGLLTPGRQLVETELSERLGISRNTLREAFRQLCREGLAEHHRHRGVVVRQVTAADVREFFRLRRLLEPQAIRRAPSPMPPGVLSAMRACVEAAAAAAERGEWREAGTQSLRFHGEIVRLAGSPRLDEFFATILAQLRLTFAINPDEEAFQAPWLARDRDIMERIVQDDRDGAVETLDRYLDISEAMLLGRFP